MPSRESRRHSGQRRGHEILRRLGTEWREMRMGAGVSQATVGAAIGLSHSQISRMEGGRVRRLSVVRAAELAAVLGADLVARLYPAGAPLRDAAHVALLERFDRTVAAPYRITREAPMRIAGDQRAWDRRLDGPVSIGVEAETRPGDLQALERRIRLKQRDSGVQRVIIVVSETRRNRDLVRSALPVLRGTFPLSTREALAALRGGRDPGGDGLVLL